MAEQQAANPVPESASGTPRSKDEVALELMKFIAVSTGYGRASQSSAGFSGKPVARSPEEQADALLDLFERCRRVVNKEN
ncbi:MAG TPA: hypothetical protein VME43_26620 [Bryobacteraceae bacterium]|nr:hypothetical protein [Bryobacteraceae bacterium]